MTTREGRLLSFGAPLARAGSHLVVAFLAVAATAAVLPEFDAERVSVGAHRPFVVGLAVVAAVAAVAAWRRLATDHSSQAALVFVAFAALAGTYSPHALLVAGRPDPAHLVFGPASRLVFAALMLAAVSGLRLPPVLRRPANAFALAAAVIVGVDAVLHLGAVRATLAREPLFLLRSAEGAAAGLELLALLVTVGRYRQTGARFLAVLGRVLMVMLVSSLLFLAATPWQLRWWVAHLGLAVAAAVLVGAILVERTRHGRLAALVDLDAASSVAELLVAELDSGLVLVDRRGEVVGWNPAAVELTGWSREDAQQRFPRAPLDGAVRLGHGDVRARQVELNRHGRAITATFLTDVSRERELELDNRRLDRMATALERANTAKAELLGMVAHDLRNPLGTVRSFAQLLHDRLRNSLDDVEELLLERIEQSSERMLRMVDELLAYTEVDDGSLSLVLEPSPGDLARIVVDTVELNRPAAERKGIRLAVEVPAGDVPAVFDGDKVDQVLTNLLSNAVKFSEPGSVVTVAVLADADEVGFVVADEGLGIPAAERDLLFRPFARTSVKPTGDESSTGLGLSIVKRIVDAHGGRIEVDSSVGVGSTFRVTLPRGQATSVA